jgi:hypothetical protein
MPTSDPLRGDRLRAAATERDRPLLPLPAKSFVDFSAYAD